jgi:hypothetical protein
MGAPFREKMESQIEATKLRQQAKFPEGVISPGSAWFAEQTARVARVARGFEKPVEQQMQEAEKFLGLQSERIPEPIRWLGGQSKRVGYGVALGAPAGAVELAGMVPVAGEAMWRRKDIIPAAVGVGAVMMGKSLWHEATTDPARLTGELIAFGAYGKGLTEVAAKASPYYRGPSAGVDVYTGKPSLWRRLIKGEKPHPTPEAKMVEMLDPALYEAPQKFFHGTSMEMLSRITKEGKIAVHPEAAPLRGPAGGEASLFLSQPGTPYAKFATPSRIAKIGTGDAAIDVKVFQLEQMIRGKIPPAEGIKSIKPSKKLSDLIAERERLSSELYAMEQSPTAPISPRRMATEAKLYDTMRAVEKQVVKDYKAATGEKVTVRDRPGAFLEIEQKPFRPSEKLVEKAKTREMLRGKEKAGTITESQRSKLRALEKELEKEALAEYFETPLGEVVPGPKPMYGYEWKGIPEAEYVMRAGSEMFLTTSARSRLYAKFGITKGTEFTLDPKTGATYEILKVTTTKPDITAPPKHLIDVPKMLDPFRPAFPKVRKLSTKQKSEVVRLKKQIADAEKVGDFDTAMRISDRVRSIELGRPTRLPPPPVRRVLHPDMYRMAERPLSRMAERDMPRMTERDMPRMTERDIPRMTERGISRISGRDVPREPPRITREPPRDVPREPPRITREPPRDVPREPPRITREPPPFIIEPPPTTYTPPPTIIRKKKDKKKVKPPKAKPEMAVGWKQKHELLTLEDFLGYKL